VTSFMAWSAVRSVSLRHGGRLALLGAFPLACEPSPSGRATLRRRRPAGERAGAARGCDAKSGTFADGDRLAGRRTRAAAAARSAARRGAIGSGSPRRGACRAPARWLTGGECSPATSILVSMLSLRRGVRDDSTTASSGRGRTSSAPAALPPGSDETPAGPLERRCAERERGLRGRDDRRQRAMGRQSVVVAGWRDFFVYLPGMTRAARTRSFREFHGAAAAPTREQQRSGADRVRSRRDPSGQGGRLLDDSRMGRTCVLRHHDQLRRDCLLLVTDRRFATGYNSGSF
jgi:hypothetical protein